MKRSLWQEIVLFCQCISNNHPTVSQRGLNISLLEITSRLKKLEAKNYQLKQSTRYAMSLDYEVK